MAINCDSLCALFFLYIIISITLIPHASGEQADSYNGTSTELSVAIPQDKAVGSIPKNLKDKASSLIADKVAAETINSVSGTLHVAKSKDVVATVNSITKKAPKKIDQNFESTIQTLSVERVNSTGRQLEDIRSQFSSFAQERTTDVIKHVAVDLKMKSTVEQLGQKARQPKVANEKKSSTFISKNQEHISGTINNVGRTIKKEEAKNEVNQQRAKNVGHHVRADENKQDKNADQENEGDGRIGDIESIDGRDLNPDDLKNVENYHMFYYILVVILSGAVFYVAVHNKKKILGILIEGWKPVGTRRSSVRYRRLSQRDDGDLYGYRDTESGVIY